MNKPSTLENHETLVKEIKDLPEWKKTYIQRLEDYFKGANPPTKQSTDSK